MVENRKLFYAITLMLLTCCQIIVMLPHNVANSESSPGQSANNTENNNNIKTTTELKDNNSSSGYKKNANSNSNNNNNDNSDFLIIATATTTTSEGKPDHHHHTMNTSEGVWQESQENDSRPADNIDDLIFLDKRTINQQHHHHHYHEQRDKQLQHQQHIHHHHHLRHNLQENEHNHYKFHHITMDGGNSNSNSNSNSDEDIDSLADTTYSTMIVVDDEQEPGTETETELENDGAIPHEIELQPDINEGVPPLNVTPLDLSDFLSLIPAAKVKAIVNHYYHNDPEVQRAYAFMSSSDFLMLKQHIIVIPEMSAFLRYLNNSGLDLVKFVTALTNLTAYKTDDIRKVTNSTTVSSDTSAATEQSGEQIIETTTVENDIQYAQKQSVTIPPTISNIETQITTITMPTAASITTATITDDINETTTIAKEQLNGLHGLVDSVLDVLPQDQILATFFDKLEANEQFSKLVDNIGSPEFAKILNNMQNSIPLRNLIFTLHNNGIYVIRIVDSLKSYFFLGGF